MKKAKVVRIETLTIMSIMKIGETDLNIPSETRQAINRLCGYEVNDINIPRAVDACKTYLLQAVTWLADVVDEINQFTECPDCVLKDIPEPDYRDCPLAHLLAGLPIVHGHAVTVPPLPEGAYTQTGNDYLDAIAALEWLLNKRMADMNVTVIAVDEVDLPELVDLEDNEQWRWN
jgi:hypothetical protein